MRNWLIVVCLLALVDFCGRVASAEEPPQPQRGVVYATRGDEPLEADIYLPAGEGPFPAVLVVHGGAWRSGSRTQMTFVAERLAESGYVAVAISYRLAPRHKFPAQIEDCKSAVRWMRAHAKDYKIDPDQIAGWGYSAGGHLVALLGTTDADDGLEGGDAKPGDPSTRLQAVIAGGAPCDFREAPEESTQLAFWLDGARKDNPKAYEQASPRAYVTADDPPIFFYHGDADKLVQMASPEAMAADLKAAGVATRLYVIPKAGHIQAIFDGAAGKEAIAFLDEHLKGKPAESTAAP